MGMINYQPGIEDEYSAEVIRLACERSPNVDNWMAEKRYLLETEEENLKPEWFRNRCCTKIITEDFDLMGIRVNMDVDVALDHADLVYGILMLRSKFDPDNIKATFKKNPELMDAVEQLDNDDPLGFIVAWCAKNIPTDDGWEMLATRLNERTAIFEGDTKFREMINDVIESIRANGEPDVTSEANEANILTMMKFLGQRCEYIRAVVETMWCKCVDGFKRESRQRVIDTLMYGFEKELGSRECLANYSAAFSLINLDDREKISEFMCAIRKRYAKKWKHSIEYYFDGEKNASEGQVALMIATMYADCPDRLHFRSWFESRLMDHVDQLSYEGVKSLVAKLDELQLVNIPDVEYKS